MIDNAIHTSLQLLISRSTIEEPASMCREFAKGGNKQTTEESRIDV